MLPVLPFLIGGALGAVVGFSLKKYFDENQSDILERTQLDTLLLEVEHKKAQYNEASKDLKDAKQLLNQDQEKLRKVLGINSKREKIIGFISGIIASLIAALIWKFLEIIF